MIHFDLPTEKSSILKVIGVGGGGSNAVNYMFNQQIEGVNFVICNTDAQALAASGIPNRVQLGPHLTQGLGAGANPDIGRQATEESLEEIRKILEVNTKMAFITAGMGGGTGTGGAPIIAKICKDLGILTVGIVTTPFAYEGKKRLQQAEEGIRQLRQHVDTLLVISNDKLRHQFGNLKMREAFEKADNVLATAARCITDVINSTGQINVDFADVRSIMKDMGDALMGIGIASGEHRAIAAAQNALNSPLLEGVSISGAQGLLVNISGGSSMTMHEIGEAVSIIEENAGSDVNLIHGIVYDESLDDKLMITVVATGFKRGQYAMPNAINVQQQIQEKIIPTQTVQQPAPTPVIRTIAVNPPQADNRQTRIAVKPVKVYGDIDDEQSAPQLYQTVQEKQQEEPVQTNRNQPAFMRRTDPNIVRQANGGSIRINSVNDLPNGVRSNSQPVIIREPKSSVVEKPAFLRKIMD